MRRKYHSFVLGVVIGFMILGLCHSLTSDEEMYQWISSWWRIPWWSYVIIIVGIILYASGEDD